MVSTCHSDAESWTALAEFLDSLPRAPLSPKSSPRELRIDKTFRSHLTEVEQTTLDLSVFFLHASIGPAVAKLPPEMRSEILSVSIQLAAEGHSLAEKIGDRSVQAVFLFCIAMMHYQGL